MGLDPVRPRALRPGDRIGVVSPAGPVERRALEAGIRMLKGAGYDIALGVHACGGEGYLAALDEARLEDLHRMFEDPEIRGVICTRGGYGSLRLLPEIRYEPLRRDPKIFVGYSDITALHGAFFRKTGLVTFHGPMVRELGQTSPANFRALLERLEGKAPPEFVLTPDQVLVSGSARGRLMGGNLATLTHLVGTPFMPSLEGCLLLLEERGEPPYRIDRMLTHLWVSGLLEGVGGILGGTFLDCGPDEVVREILASHGRRLGVPTVAGLPFGHGKENRAVPLGVPALLDTDGQRFRVLDTGLC